MVPRELAAQEPLITSEEAQLLSDLPLQGTQTRIWRTSNRGSSTAQERHLQIAGSAVFD